MPEVLPENGMSAECFLVTRRDGVPNNERLPVILYRHAIIEPDDCASAFERMFETNGWPPQWRDGIFSYHHYHSTAHEVLGFARGWARLGLGGPGGREVQVSRGDAVLLPAGTGHIQVEASSDFLVVGAYPPGQSFDTCREAPSEAMMLRMREVPFPACDPIGGRDGPLPRVWQR